MSTSNGTNMTLVCTFALTGGAFAFHHAWKFDRCKCLIPRRKDWFRVLLTWMLLMSLLSLAIWASGWTYIKYQLGWMIVPGVGAVPFPNALWTEQYKGYNLPLTFWVNFAYWLQVCLNAEEGLYWYHLMRAVRTPKSASSWLRSSFFYSWIVICLVCGVIQFGVSWIAFEDMIVQSGRMYACGGVIEVIVVLTSSIVIFKFPAFLRDVKNSGAGPEVRARLHFYHEANKVRTFFRLIFSVTLTILGFDALTEAKKINMTPLAADMMQQAAFGAYFLAYIVNVVLYLPRNSYGKAGPRIMVGPADPRANDPAAPRALGAPGGHLASNALMSLLREGGQWDEIDDQAFDQTRGLGLSTPAGGRTASKLFADGAYKFKGDWDDSASGTSGKPVLNHRESDGDLDAVGNAGGMGNKALENWQSPFSVPMVEELPKQLRIVVQREVEHDGEMGAR